MANINSRTQFIKEQIGLGKKRKFGGKITDFSTKKEEQHEKRHLKAYLKGAEKFQNGRDKDGDVKMFDVKEEWV